MKKQNPIYLFSVIMSLGIAGFVMFFLVSGFGAPFFILTIILFLGILMFFMFMADKLNSHSFEDKFKKLKECHNCKTLIPKESEFCPSCGSSLKDTIECEYCGHINKIDTVFCEKCNGLIG